MLNLALLGRPGDMTDAARYYENVQGHQDKAVMLYHKVCLWYFIIQCPSSLWIFLKAIYSYAFYVFIVLIIWEFSFEIFTFNKHFDKEIDCVYEPVITKPHHWRRIFITFYIVNFFYLKTKTRPIPLRNYQ